MADHQKYVDLALRLITKHGRLVSLGVVSGTPVDVNKPWRGTDQAPVIMGPVMAAIVPFRGFEFGSLFEQQDMFKECDEICIIAGGQEEFENAHNVYDESKTYAVQWVQRLRPGPLTILYAIGINR